MKAQGFDAKCKVLDQMYRLMDVCQTCVFVNRQETADRLGEAMRGLGHEVGVIRGGDMEKKERVRILNEFKEGKIKVLICTDLLSRGIDILDVTLVVNFDIPKKGETMVGERGEEMKRRTVRPSCTDRDERVAWVARACRSPSTSRSWRTWRS